MKNLLRSVVEHFAKRMAILMSERISSAAAAILEGLDEALKDANGELVEGLRKTTNHDDDKNSSLDAEVNK